MAKPILTASRSLTSGARIKSMALRLSNPWPTTHPCSSPLPPNRLPRRDFLRVGTLALGGLTLPDLLQCRAASSTSTLDTSVILFWMWGGPSQLETYDMKPNAPSEYRGPLRPIRTNVTGIEICEYMPLQARLPTSFRSFVPCIIGWMPITTAVSRCSPRKTPVVPDPTSVARSTHPDFGMIASYCRGTRRDGLPQYVGAQRAPFMINPTYLGVSHKAYETGDPSSPQYAPHNLRLVTGVDNGPTRRPSRSVVTIR